MITSETHDIFIISPNERINFYRKHVHPKIKLIMDVFIESEHFRRGNIGFLDNCYTFVKNGLKFFISFHFDYKYILIQDNNSVDILSCKYNVNRSFSWIGTIRTKNIKFVLKFIEGDWIEYLHGIAEWIESEDKRIDIERFFSDASEFT